MQKPLTAEKIRNLIEIYESYISLELWPLQLSNALNTSEQNSTQREGSSRTPLSLQYNTITKHIGRLLNYLNGSARVIFLLRTDHRSSRLSDEAMSTDSNNPSSTVKIMPKRNRGRSKEVYKSFSTRI